MPPDLAIRISTAHAQNMVLVQQNLKHCGPYFEGLNIDISHRQIRSLGGYFETAAPPSRSRAMVINFNPDLAFQPRRFCVPFNPKMSVHRDWGLVPTSNPFTAWSEWSDFIPVHQLQKTVADIIDDDLMDEDMGYSELVDAFAPTEFANALSQSLNSHGTNAQKLFGNHGLLYRYQRIAQEKS